MTPAAKQISPWPVHPQIMSDELFSSWLIRLAHGNGFKVQTFCATYFGASAQIWTRDIDRSLPADLRAALSARTGQPENRIEQATLRSLVGNLFEEMTPSPPWLLPLSTRGRKYKKPGLVFCRKCFQEDQEPYIRKGWRIGWSTVCVRHGCLLEDACPSCHAVLMPHRSDVAKRSRLVRGVSMATCWSCGHDMRLLTNPLVPASSAQIERQAVLEHALTNGHLDAVGRQGLHSLPFFQGLRSIAQLYRRERQLEGTSAERGSIEVEPLTVRDAVLTEIWKDLKAWPEAFRQRCAGLRRPYSKIRCDGKALPWWLHEVVEPMNGAIATAISSEEVDYVESLVFMQKGHYSRARALSLAGRDVGGHLKGRRDSALSSEDAELFMAGVDQLISVSQGAERQRLLRDKVLLVTARALRLNMTELSRVQMKDVLDPVWTESAGGLACLPTSKNELQPTMQWYVKEVRATHPLADIVPWLFVGTGVAAGLSAVRVGQRFKALTAATCFDRRIRHFEQWAQYRPNVAVQC